MASYEVVGQVRLDSFGDDVQCDEREYIHGPRSSPSTNLLEILILSKPKTGSELRLFMLLVRENKTVYSNPQ